MGLSFSYGKDGWEAPKEDSAWERANYALGRGNRRRAGSKADHIREAAEGMRSAPGGRTPSRKPMSRKEKRDADRILREGKRK